MRHSLLSDGTITELRTKLFPVDWPGNDIDDKKQIQPASIDLRLGDRIKRWSLDPALKGVFIDPEADNSRFYEDVVIPATGYVLYPGPENFCLGVTREYVFMPNDLKAQVDGRSSYGRLALKVHSTAGFIDPGFQGCITLEIENTGIHPILLLPGRRICQLSFINMDAPAVRPYGSLRGSKYQNSTGVVASKIHEDK